MRSGEKATWKSRPAFRPDSEDRHEALAGRAGIGRGLQHDELAWLQHLAERGGRGDQRAEIGLAVDRQGRRNAEDDGIHPCEARIAARGVDASAQRSEHLGGHVLDVGLSPVEGIDLANVGVQRDDLSAGLCEGYDERKPDISQPDNPDFQVNVVVRTDTRACR